MKSQVLHTVSVVKYFWWGCRGKLKLITFGSERINSWRCTIGQPDETWRCEKLGSRGRLGKQRKTRSMGVLTCHMTHPISFPPKLGSPRASFWSPPPRISTNYAKTPRRPGNALTTLTASQWHRRNSWPYLQRETASTACEFWPVF